MLELTQNILLTLQKCGLNLENLPNSRINKKSLSDFNTCSVFSTITKSWSAKGLDEMHEILQKNERSRPHFNAKDIFIEITNNRELALKRMKNHKQMMDLINDEIEYIKHKTGVTQIHWLINWELSFMRSCLLKLQAMITQSDVRESIIHALNGRKLSLV